MFKKMVALLLLSACCLCLVACNADDDSTPDGMKLASQSGEPFLLYVPESWTLNTASGISGASLYYTVDSISAMVTAHFVTRNNQAQTVEQYVDGLIAAYTASVTDFHVTDKRNDALLSDLPAWQIDYTATINGAPMIGRELVVFYGEDAVSLHWYIAVDRDSEDIRTSLKQIEDEFILCDKQILNTNVTDKNTPDGMKIASADHIEYRFYVPTDWICNAESDKSEAYHPADRSNVTVASYAPEVSMSVSDYFSLSEARYVTVLQDYARIGEPVKSTVAGKEATSYTYKAVVSGTEYRFRQTVFVYGDRMYSITYTAKADCFDAHLADVDRMLGSFCFR